MPDENPPNDPASNGALEEQLGKIQAQLSELAKTPGMDDTVKTAITGALADAKKTAEDAVKARQAAKDEANTAMEQVAELRAQMEAVDRMSAARDAGAVNPETVSRLLVGVKPDEVGSAVKKLQETDPYLFGSPDSKPPAKTGQPDMSGGNGRKASAPDPGLKAFGDHLSEIAGT